MSKDSKLNSKKKCLVCFSAISLKSFNIFYTYYNEQISLVNILQTIVKKNLQSKATLLPSTLICEQCCDLLQEYATTETKLKQINDKILITFRNNSKSFVLDEIPDFGIACQTDHNPEFPFCEIGEENKEVQKKKSSRPEKNIEKEEATNSPSSGSWSKTEVRKRQRPLIHPCKQCGRLFRRPCEVRQHMLSHGGNKPFRCRECGKLFGSRSGAGNHTLKKHGKADDIELVSNKEQGEQSLETNNENETLDNVEKATNGNEDDDDDCDLAWKTDETFGEKEPSRNVMVKGKKKRERIRPSVSAELECPTCSARWRTKRELRLHVATHSDVRPFICEICGQGYKHMNALKVHVGMHHGVNPFTCPHCNKAFTQKGALQRHLPIHTGEAPFQCELCGKRFLHHTSFNMHTLAHTGQKSYKCEICGLMLLSRSHLRRHTRVHTGERPYACDTCGKRFAQRYNLSAHQRVHETPANATESAAANCPSKTFWCSTCDITFDRKANLEHHMAICHNKLPEPADNYKWFGHIISNEPETFGATTWQTPAPPPNITYPRIPTVFSTQH